MIPADFFPTSQRWQADGLAVYTAPHWRNSRQVGDRFVCQVACESALDTPEPQRPATETWAQGYQAAAMIAAAPEMFRILKQLGAAGISCAQILHVPCSRWGPQRISGRLTWSRRTQPSWRRPAPSSGGLRRPAGLPDPRNTGPG